jgi:transcriptional regulator with GAF, ATPase, and Fis domain
MRPTNPQASSTPRMGSLEDLDALEEPPFALTPVAAKPDGRGTISPQEVDQIVDENRNLKQLHQIVSFLGSFSNLNELSPEIVDLGLKITGLNRGLLAVVEGQENEHCRMKILKGWKRNEQSSPNYDLAKRMITLAAKDDRPYFITDLNAQKSSRSRSHMPTIQAIIALPLRDKNKIFGILVFADEQNRSEFSHSERELLTKYADHAAMIYSKLSNDSGAVNRDLERSHKALQSRLDTACQRIRELQQNSSPKGPLEVAEKRFYKSYLSGLVQRNRGSFTRAAEEAGIQREILIELVQKYKILKNRS